MPLGPGGGVVQTAGTSLADVVLVQPGHAALARDVSGGNSQTVGPVYLITDTGTRYMMAPGAGDQNGKALLDWVASDEELWKLQLAALKANQ